MERRRSERYELDIDAEIIFNGHRAAGVIENFSDGGLGIRCGANEYLKDAGEGARIIVEFIVFHLEKANFNCEMVWHKEFADPALGKVLRIGLKYLDKKNIN
ncbi:MAG: PilZ domain-containing protein [Nitrospirae bacterium]|nr:PilZ domain-containing protein [Nitrospirota bacterium]